MPRWQSNDEAQIQARMKKRQQVRLLCMFGTISQIKKIEPKLHFIRLSGEYYYPDLRKAFGSMKKMKAPLKRMPIYRTWYIAYFKGIKINVFIGRLKCKIPNCRLEFSLPDQSPAELKDDMELVTYQKQYLNDLNNLLPGLGVSGVEYAIDIFPSDGFREVRTLFKLVQRYLFVPHVRKIKLMGGQEESGHVEIRGKVRMSQVLRAGRALKFYERGSDGDRDRETKGWKCKDIDRLRLEFTASRKYLKKMGIDTLDDLIMNPICRKVFKKRIQFIKAKISSSNLPQEYEQYDSIQKEFWAVCDAKGRRYYQERDWDTRLNEMLQAIHELTVWFDRCWLGHSVQRPFWFGGSMLLIQ